MLMANHHVGADDSCCTMNVAVWQGEAKAGDLQANLTVAIRKIREAAASGVELLLFPELFLSGYDCTKTQLLEGCCHSPRLLTAATSPQS